MLRREAGAAARWSPPACLSRLRPCSPPDSSARARSGGALAGFARTATVRLPPAPKAAFEIGPPVKLARHRDETTWAAVRRDVTARKRPARSARAVGVLRARTPEATTNIVLPLARRRAGGRLWVRVRLPALPNGTTGWIPRAALGANGTVRTRLAVDLAAPS